MEGIGGIVNPHAPSRQDPLAHRRDVRCDRAALRPAEPRAQPGARPPVARSRRDELASSGCPRPRSTGTADLAVATVRKVRGTVVGDFAGPCPLARSEPAWAQPAIRPAAGRRAHSGRDTCDAAWSLGIRNVRTRSRSPRSGASSVRWETAILEFGQPSGIRALLNFTRPRRRLTGLQAQQCVFLPPSVGRRFRRRKIRKIVRRIFERSSRLSDL
jgi:hypothetical protein